ncbi:hypothetical protein EHQ24_00140 [Leptospira noumeaensis]|uniref:Uncharacterized protein n=1 Tax=Leptospira noumeaensis TaxID=2484964 RepID=A0A4R9IGW6_9LEPT|nr:hypothetical protein [Leptospira noumeaensis]TGK87668.1 hypothetical protein EHQ24_00140 [Leptospira noumeaensis]
MRIDRKINIKYREKKLIRLYRELNLIRKKISSLPLIELKKPIFHSYGLIWTLKLQSSKYKEAYLYLIDKFSKIKHVKNLKKINQMEPEPIVLDKDGYRSLLEKYPDAVRWFIKRKNRFKKTEYVFNKVAILEKKLVKVMITHRRDIEPDLESRKREIEDVLYTNSDNSGKLDNLLGIRHYFDSDKTKFQRNIIELYDLNF